MLTSSTASAKRLRSLLLGCLTARCSAVLPALLRAAALAPHSSNTAITLRCAPSTACKRLPVVRHMYQPLGVIGATEVMLMHGQRFINGFLRSQGGVLL